MSEKDRQRKKMELRLKERRLREEGQWEEAAALLGMGGRRGVVEEEGIRWGHGKTSN